MTPRKWALAFSFLASWSLAAAEPLSFAPRDGVLVLRNGHIMAGTITPLNDSYLISVSAGSEIRVARTDVEFDCGSLEEAYLIKRDTLPHREARAHAELASWCLKHSLWSRAADQLLALQVADAKSPSLASLQRRLETMVQQSQLAATSQATPVLAKSETPSQATPLSLEDANLPPFLIQQFTTIVHPILLNRCANYACHGANSSSAYRLLKPSLGRVATSRLTLKNLHASLAYVDREDTAASPLLKMTLQPHGGVEPVQFQDKAGAQLAHVAAWIRRLDMKIPATPAGKWQPPVESAVPRENLEPAVGVSERPGEPAATFGLPVEAGAADLGGDTLAPSPLDPFDVDSFNRRYHGDGQR